MSRAGRVYIYQYNNGVFAIPQTLTAPNPQAGEEFGNFVDVGDINADGNPDIVVGAWLHDPGGKDDAGRFIIFFGPAFTSTFSQTEPLVGDARGIQPKGPDADSWFGHNFNVRDVDHDGRDDIIVGAPHANVQLSGMAGAVDNVGESFAFLNFTGTSPNYWDYRQGFFAPDFENTDPSVDDNRCANFGYTNYFGRFQSTGANDPLDIAVGTPGPYGFCGDLGLGRFYVFKAQFGWDNVHYIRR